MPSVLNLTTAFDDDIGVRLEQSLAGTISPSSTPSGLTSPFDRMVS
jgi:hypothetical protein